VDPSDKRKSLWAILEKEDSSNLFSGAAISGGASDSSSPESLPDFFASFKKVFRDHFVAVAKKEM
jgi:hypothetical protein